MTILKILYLAHRIPYPPNKGDKIRSFNEIKYLSESHDIHLAALVDNPDDLKYRKELNRYCSDVCLKLIDPLQNRLAGILLLPFKRSISVGYFYSRKLQKKIDHLLQRHHYDAIICFSSPMAEYLYSSPSWPALKKRKYSGGTRLIMDFCDLDSDKWKQYAEKSSFPLNWLYRLEWKLLLTYEKKVNDLFDESIFVSSQEADLFLKYYPKARNISVIPNGVDHQYFSPNSVEVGMQRVICQISKVNEQSFNTTVPGKQSPQLNKPNRPKESDKLNEPNLLFTGAMDYHANVDGVLWFCEKIFPLIQQKIPSVTFYIVGSNPAPALRQLGLRDNIVVTGFVDDIRPYYSIADVCVIPLRLARGIQNKVLESMAMAKPVVTTSKAAEGLASRNKRDMLIEDKPEFFADSVCDLLLNNKKSYDLGEAARKYVKENFDWARNIQLMERTVLKKSCISSN